MRVKPLHARSLHVHACSDDGKPETRPPLLVTASVDRIALARRLALDADLTMAGSVMWTGRSALDIRMQLRQVWVCTHSTRSVRTSAAAPGACVHTASEVSERQYAAATATSGPQRQAHEETQIQLHRV